MSAEAPKFDIKIPAAETQPVVGKRGLRLPFCNIRSLRSMDVYQKRMSRLGSKIDAPDKSLRYLDTYQNAIERALSVLRGRKNLRYMNGYG